MWFVSGDESVRTGIQALEAELARASDRAAAVLAGSLVETRLTTFLRHRVNYDKKIWDKLTHSSAPLGTFSVKIDIAFLFGFISRLAHDDLVIVKEIRNRFAHDLELRDFGSQSIRDKCFNLRLVETYVVDHEAVTAIIAMDGTPDSIVNDEKDTFRFGGKSARTELSDPRARYIWTAKIFNLAFGLLLPPQAPLDKRS